jgi:excisionase family DNA binding protein
VDTRQLLVVKEVSQLTRLSKSMIYKLINEGILRRVKLPGCSKVLIDASEVQQYIEKGVKAAAD